MNTQELLNMNYQQLVELMKQKYGPVPYDYFCTPSCKSVNLKNSRTYDGLEIHHIDEDKHPLLSSTRFATKSNASWELQKAERLVYANLFEHLILHIKICELNNKDFMPGIRYIANRINTYYESEELHSWHINMFEIIKNSFDDYIMILKYQLQRTAKDNISYMNAMHILCSNTNRTYNIEVFNLLFEIEVPGKDMWKNLPDIITRINQEEKNKEEKLLD